ncbi:hypothetical protein [Shinella sp.]|uniref:hypothetical protein n=1 Tax=Shinella sp. TaxID=1870904 RepID=UPI0028AB2EC3|nr:hypothetical protein [Shinella sp.]
MNKTVFAMIVAAGAACLTPADAAFAGEAEACRAVRLSDLGWTDIALTKHHGRTHFGRYGL